MDLVPNLIRYKCSAATKDMGLVTNLPVALGHLLCVFAHLNPYPPPPPPCASTGLSKHGVGVEPPFFRMFWDRCFLWF